MKVTMQFVKAVDTKSEVVYENVEKVEVQEGNVTIHDKNFTVPVFHASLSMTYITIESEGKKE